MQQRKIIQLLKLLSHEEIKKLDHFVRSPYFNKNKKLASLLAYFRPFHPDFSANKLTEEAAFQSLFGDESYDENRLNRLFHKLCKLVDEFIEHELLQRNPEVGYLFRLSFYEERNQSLFLDQQLKAFRQWLDKHQPKHYSKNLARFYLENTQSNFIHRQQQYHQGDVNLQKAMDALDHFYLQEKLMLADGHV